MSLVSGAPSFLGLSGGKGLTEREMSFPGVKKCSCRIYKVGRQVCRAASLQRGKMGSFKLLTLSILAADDTRDSYGNDALYECVLPHMFT